MKAQTTRKTVKAKNQETVAIPKKLDVCPTCHRAFQNEKAHQCDANSCTEHHVCESSSPVAVVAKETNPDVLAKKYPGRYRRYEDGWVRRDVWLKPGQTVILLEPGDIVSIVRGGETIANGDAASLEKNDLVRATTLHQASSCSKVSQKGDKTTKTVKVTQTTKGATKSGTAKVTPSDAIKPTKSKSSGKK